MTLKFLGNISAVTDGYTLAASEDAIVGPGYLVHSSGANGIVGDNTQHRVTIAGLVAAQVDGIHLGTDSIATSVNQVTVLAGGIVSGGDDAVDIQGSSARVENFGSISGRYGVFIQADLIVGESVIGNHGVIVGEVAGILQWGNQSKVVYNSGTIDGGSYSYYSTDAAIDRLFNTGLMRGTVMLGLGDDTYDGRGGSIEGTVFGEGGADTFFAGAGVEAFDGGAGIDTLNLKSSAGGRVDLSGGESGTGVALGDSYVDIETVLGSASGGDTIIGSAAANTLYGFGGDDVLQGGDGADILEGGEGADSLTGGAGSDIFRFRALASVGDSITDFAGVAGNDDAFRISAAAFGGGLVAGALAASQFRMRADNLAQDADDRFIFRTTDRTLWFDVDGTGTEAALMVADLQVGAVVTAADIFLI